MDIQDRFYELAETIENLETAYDNCEIKALKLDILDFIEDVKKYYDYEDLQEKTREIEEMDYKEQENEYRRNVV